MNGLLLSKLFYEAYWAHMEEKVKDRYQVESAYGLFGEGSECFGYDDELSRDHHWGAGLCIWLPDQSPLEALTYINDYYQNLPSEFHGFPVNKPVGGQLRRIGAMRVSTFVQHVLGTPQLPQTWAQWLHLPEYGLASMSNGVVLNDLGAVITPVRRHFAGYYPPDVCTKRIATWAMVMGQSGQYNYIRCLKRHDEVTAHYTLGLFIEAACGMVHGLNRRFMPYYKWMHRSLEGLPILGEVTSKTLTSLVKNANKEHELRDNVPLIEELCWNVVLELQKQGFTTGDKDFLFDQGPMINAGIKDEVLRQQPLLLA
jgi:hypothetical protein